MGSRTWFKIYAEPWLSGSLRGQKPELRGVFADLLAMVSNTQFADHGFLAITKSAGFSDKMISETINIDVRKWKKIKQILLDLNIIEVYGGNIIKIMSWAKYQSEYRRQKGYRSKLQKTNTEYNKKSYTEIEREKEKEKEKEVFDFQSNKANNDPEITPTAKKWLQMANIKPPHEVLGKDPETND